MSKPKSDGGWLLPDPIDAGDRIGVCVQVPNQPEHRQAFLGALLELTRWWNWQRDEAKRGREAAQVWRTIWNDVLQQLGDGGGCDMSAFDVRQNDDAPCVLEKTTNDGQQWTPFANLALCRPKIPPVITSAGTVYVEYENEVISIDQLPPDADTVTSSNRRRPVGDDADTDRCLAALNAAYVFRRLHEESWKFAPFTNNPFNIIVSAAIALVGLGVIAPVGIPFFVAGALMGFLYVANREAYTSDVEREFACILKNNSYVDNGEVRFDFGLVKQAVQSRITNINVWQFIAVYLDVIQPNGLNLAGTTTQITQCCDPCITTFQDYDIDLTLSANQNMVQPIEAVDSTWTWINGAGWRLQGVNNAIANGTVKIDLAVNPNSQILNLYWRFQVSSEPYRWELNTNGQTRVQSGYRPFGNFFHGLTNSLSSYTSSLHSVLKVLSTHQFNGLVTIDRVRIRYRGCPPL